MIISKRRHDRRWYLSVLPPSVPRIDGRAWVCWLLSNQPPLSFNCFIIEKLAMCCRLADGRRTTKYHHVSWKKKNCFLSIESLKAIPFCHDAIGERRLAMATGCHLKSSTWMETDREETRNWRKLSYYKKSCFVDLTRHGVSLYMICSIIACFRPSGTIICKQINDLVFRFPSFPGFNSSNTFLRNIFPGCWAIRSSVLY